MYFGYLKGERYFLQKLIKNKLIFVLLKLKYMGMWSLKVSVFVVNFEI